MWERRIDVALRSGSSITLDASSPRNGPADGDAPARHGVAIDEDDLVIRIRAGEEEAFAQLVNHTAASLYAYAASFLRSPEAARDLVQDVFAELWERRTTLAPSTTLTRHLFGAARFRALHQLRRQRIEARSVPAVVYDTSVEPSLDTVLERADLYAAAVRAARTLPPRAAAVFTLRWGEGLSYAAIAERLGISVKGVEVQMTRALRAIRAQLEGETK